MSYEPRSRGMRSRRTYTKKQASRESKSNVAPEFVYREANPINPEEVASRVMNELEHLGAQRFGMPPFAEHFQRWIIDVKSVTDDLRNAVPNLNSPGFEMTVGSIIKEVQSNLSSRIVAETKYFGELSNLQNELVAIERKIAALESQQRTETNALRRTTEKSMMRVRGEIDALGSQRLKLVRSKPTLLERIMGTAKVRIEGNARSLHSRQATLRSEETEFKMRLESIKSDYDEKRKPLVGRRAEIREQLTKLQSQTIDDALDTRKSACEELRRGLSDALLSQNQTQNQPAPP